MSRCHADPEQATSPLADETCSQQAGVGSSEGLMGNAWQAELAAKEGGGSLLPHTKAEALARHAEGARRVDRVVRSALAQEPSPTDPTASRLVMLHNSAEWIATGRVKLLCLSPTHDSATRAPPGKTAYFDDRKSWDEPGANYDDSTRANGPGIYVGFPAAGHMEGDRLVIFEAQATTDDDIANTLIHEIQHRCDKGPGQAFVEPESTTPEKYKAKPWVYEAYRSEFRARLCDPVQAARYGDPTTPCTRKLSFTATRDSADPDVVSGTLPLTETIQTAFFNEQQFDIFSEMVDSSITEWRDYGAKEWKTSYAFFAHFFVFDMAFRDMVEFYGEKGPHGSPMDGGNLVNSIRIEDLATQIQANAPDAEILAGAGALDAVDRAFLRDQALSDPFWKPARQALGSRKGLLADVERLVQTGVADVPLTYESYEVVQGDTLSRIAETMLGDMWRWPELHALNEAEIGSDPDHLDVGVKLRLPRT